MFDDDFSLDDAVKAAALLALVGGGAAGARAGAKAFKRYVPTYGAMTSDALAQLGVQNPRAMREKLIAEARRLNASYAPDSSLIANRAAEAEVLENLGLIASPRVLDTAVYNEDKTVGRTVNRLQEGLSFENPLGSEGELEALKRLRLVGDSYPVDGEDIPAIRFTTDLEPTFDPLTSASDYRPFDVISQGPGKPLIATDKPSAFKDKEVTTYYKGRKARPTSLKRAAEAIANRNLPEAERQTLKTKGSSIETVGYDPNDPASVDALAEDIVKTATRNLQVRQLFDSVRQRQKIGSQLGYLRDARTSAKVRPQIAANLGKYADELVQKYASVGGTLPKDVAYDRVVSAFAALSPRANIATNWKRLRTAIDTLVAEDSAFSDIGTLMRPDLDEWIRTPAGREWKRNFENQTIAAGQRALVGEAPVVDFAMREMAKVPLTKSVIMGNVNSGIADSDVIEQAILTSPLFKGLSSADRSKVISQVFNNPVLYNRIVDALNSSLSQGPLADAGWLLTGLGKKNNLANLQSALQMRSAGEAGEIL